MNTIFTKLRVPAFISLMVVFPFMLLEINNRKDFPESFPLFLFLALWLILILFIIISRPLLGSFNSSREKLRPFNLVTRLTLAVLLALSWIGIIVDQVPCFLGAVNCD